MYIAIAFLTLALTGAWILVPDGRRRRAEQRLDARCRERRAIVLGGDDMVSPETEGCRVGHPGEVVAA